ncbi:MAG: hypothetical protein FJX76_08970 [Armatimonadetes bacterium]|nr:hypothetical protein [Armatimonadota bacterium]
MPPLLRAFLLCHEVRQSPRGTDLLGVFNRINAPSFPVEGRAYVHVVWSNLEPGEHQMSIGLIGPRATVGQWDVKVVKTSPERDDWMYTQAVQLHFPERQDWIFQISLDGEPYGNFYLAVDEKTR